MSWWRGPFTVSFHKNENPVVLRPIKHMTTDLRYMQPKRLRLTLARLFKSIRSF